MSSNKPVCHSTRPAPIRFAAAAATLPALAEDSFAPQRNRPSAVTAAPPGNPFSKILEKHDLIRQVLQVGNVSSAFHQQVNTLIQNRVPTPLLQSLANAAYTLTIQHHITENRPDLTTNASQLNERGGLNEPEAKRITVAEYVQQLASDPPIWLENQYWQNAVVHELGHAIDSLLGKMMARQTEVDNPLRETLSQFGASQHPEFVSAYQQDYETMPDTMQLASGPLGYFFQAGQQADQTIPFRVGRQETFAECVDILLRGQESTYNYDHFIRYFPRTLQTVAKLLSRHYPVFLSVPSPQEQAV